MRPFMVLCTFREGTSMDEVFALAGEEAARVEALTAEGRMGAVHLALSRGTVFLEVFAEDEAGAVETVASLPMSRWWDLDVYPIAAPGGGL